MFVKFDEKGKVIAYSGVAQIAEILPDSMGFEVLQTLKVAEDIRYVKKINGQIIVDETAKTQAAINFEKRKQILSLSEWFDNFYTLQLEQAQRAQRTGTEWHTADNIKTYYSLAELDAEANNKQNQIRSLKEQLQRRE